MSMKNPLTPAGIEPATLRFVAQHLNHCATLYFYTFFIYLPDGDLVEVEYIRGTYISGHLLFIINCAFVGLNTV